MRDCSCEACLLCLFLLSWQCLSCQLCQRETSSAGCRAKSGNDKVAMKPACGPHTLATGPSDLLPGMRRASAISSSSRCTAHVTQQQAGRSGHQELHTWAAAVLAACHNTWRCSIRATTPDAAALVPGNTAVLVTCRCHLGASAGRLQLLPDAQCSHCPHTCCAALHRYCCCCLTCTLRMGLLLIGSA